MILTLSTNTMPNRNIQFYNYSIINADTKAFLLPETVHTVGNGSLTVVIATFKNLF